MALVYSGICSHAPDITGRSERADPVVRDAFLAAFRRMGDDIRASRPDALVVIAAEHFGNFFMNNMPSFAIGMADFYEGPIEDEAFLRIKRRRVPGNKALSAKASACALRDSDSMRGCSDARVCGSSEALAWLNSFTDR